MTPGTLDVLWVWDEGLRGAPKFKMAVCVEPDAGLFLRINTRDLVRPCVPILRRDHPFLDHDSHVECDLAEYDDYAIEEGRDRGGIVGRLALRCVPEIREALMAAATISDRDKRLVAAALDLAMRRP